MSTIAVFDPPMCCSSGVCGAKPDPVLPRFAADLKWLQSQGIEVSRYNLAQQPQAFVEAEPVRLALQDQGEEALPLVLVEGEVAYSGRYPTRQELAGLFELTDDADDRTYSTEAVAELVAIGASAAANCDTCLRYHSKRAEDLGLDKDDIASAVQVGIMVKQVPERRLLAMAERQGLIVVQDEDDDEEAGSCCDLTNGCCGGDDETEEGQACCG